MDIRVPETPFKATNEYVVREQIGAGGMGTVHRAFDVQLRRDVALKVLNRLDTDSLERFVREREITADLDHPAFVRILSMGYLNSDAGRRPFYTMPLLRGETLAELMFRRSRADDDGVRLREEYTQVRLVQLVQQLCLALESAHARGIVHRDLKPSNIILGPYGEVYVVDLGLAKYVQDPERKPEAADAGTEEDEDMTARSPAGTPFYSAPEQILDPASVDARTDVFGLGAILYFVLTGHHPLYRDRNALKPAPPDSQAVRADVNGGSVGFIVKPAQFPHWSDTEQVPSSSRSEVVIRALHGALIPPDEVEIAVGGESGMDAIEPALVAVCVKALAREPDERYGSCRAMWRELQQHLEGQAEMILKREAADLTRSATRRTVPQALRDFELAEGRLRQRIVQKENVGRLGIEEKLDLFDLLLEKAKIYERRGDSESIIRGVTRTGPILETALEVLNRQHIQMLIAQGSALAAQQDRAEAKTILTKALELAKAHQMEDLLGAACGAFGTACAGSDDPRELEAGRAALADSIKFSDRAGDLAQGVRSRVGLARLQGRTAGEQDRAESRLQEALRLAGEDRVLLAEVRTALAEFHLGRRDFDQAADLLSSAMKHAHEADAQNLVREIHFLLGQARLAQGDAPGGEVHFRQALHVRGPRRTAMEKRIEEFRAQNGAKPVPPVGARKARKTGANRR